MFVKESLKSKIEAKEISSGSDINSSNSNKERMTTSYTEIAFQPHWSSKSGFPNNAEVTTPDESREAPSDQGPQTKSDRALMKRPASLLFDKSFPYVLEGTVLREGDMTHFVADNLEYKIKLASPITKRDLNQAAALSRNGTPSNSTGFLQRNFLQTNLTQIDSNVLSDIEIDAQYLAASIDNLTENLYNLLHSVSSITADNVEIHKNSVNKLTDNMDANIKCMYTIMAKTEEISKSMRPTEQLALRIRETKRLVDILENSL